MKKRNDLTRPRERRRVGIHYDPEAFGQFSETIARFLGTARFLVIQSVIVFCWIVANVAFVAFRWDPYPFILLNLAFSTQAAYAAPLILLAQNRQEDRERRQLEYDRELATRTQADTEYLARELAGVRLALADVVTGDDMREHLDKVLEAIDDLSARVNGAPQDQQHDA